MEHVAQGLSTQVHGVRLLFGLAQERPLGKAQRVFAAQGARRRRTQALAEGRKPSPTAAILDSQSVKAAEQGGTAIGYDAGKKIGGRKRHLLVDTLGLILGVCVTSASVQDRDGAVTLLSSLYLLFGRLQIIWADRGYSGALVTWVKGLRPFGKLHLDIVRRSDGAKGFQLVKKRWIVERTFSWLYKCRRLSRDYEKRVGHAESHIYVCMCRLMLKRLANK